MRTSIHSEVTGITRHSPRSGLQLIAWSPRWSAFLPPSSAKIASRELDTSAEVSGPHAFAVRVRRPRLWHRPRPPRPARTL